MLIFIFLLIGGYFLWLFISAEINSSKENKKHHNDKTDDIDQLLEEVNQIIGTEENEITKDYSHEYQKKYLLTKNEYSEYKKLRIYAEEKNLLICPKVRLLDIIAPREGKNYMSLLGKIQSKHVDFVITDRNLYIKAILELDDNSHNRPDRAERDRFVDEILTSVGYKVIRTRSITEDTLKDL